MKAEKIRQAVMIVHKNNKDVCHCSYCVEFLERTICFIIKNLEKKR